MGGVTEAYVYDTANLSDSTTSNPSLTFRAGALVKRWLFGPLTDEPLAYEDYTTTTAPASGSVIELLANRLGSIITAISVSTGAVAAEYDYDSYGTRTATAEIDQPYGFTGREHDLESGLIHFRARAYDPAAGVFLQQDPAEFGSRSFNFQAYAENNPFNRIDPAGLASEEKAALDKASLAMTASAVGTVAGGEIGLAAYLAAELEAVTVNLGTKIALGSRFSGLYTFASDIGANTLMYVDEMIWKDVFRKLVANASVEFHVSMKGFFGNSFAEMIANEMVVGSNTGWELKILAEAKRLNDVIWYTIP